MKKIIHLSDLHIGYSDMEERFQVIIKNIVFSKQPASNYVIVITGDLVERATSPNYEGAKMCVDKLKEEGYTVLPVPGNHDYSNLLFAVKKNVGRFKETYFDEPKQPYPKLDIIGETGEKIAFIGLDSMAEELHWYDSMWANGEVGAGKGEQLERLEKMLKSDSVTSCKYKVVYLHHHPFEPLHAKHKLKDAEEFCNTLKNHKIDALLFGHNHYGKKWNGCLGIPRCYDGGSSTRKFNVTCEHRVIDLSRDASLDYDGDFFGNYDFDSHSK
jgi:3',5'-cyclic AMP phosphodiesterase CpdA